MDQNVIDSLAFPESSHHSNRRAVSFSSRVITHEPSPLYTLEDMRPIMWWSTKEISQFNKTERSTAKKFLKQHPTFISLFKQVFQDCSAIQQQQVHYDSSSRDHSHQQKDNMLMETDSVKSLLEKPNDIRGLECRVISLIRKYRKVHIQNVLDVVASGKQKPAATTTTAAAADNSNSNNNNVEIHEALLRARSLRTSRPSRALARVLARYDSNVTASIIREELLSEEEELKESQSLHDLLSMVIDDDDMSLDTCEQQQQQQDEEVEDFQDDEDDVDDLYDSLKLLHQSDGKATLY